MQIFQEGNTGDCSDCSREDPQVFGFRIEHAVVLMSFFFFPAKHVESCLGVAEFSSGKPSPVIQNLPLLALIILILSFSFLLRLLV